ncbi:hypothetical protein ACLMJK_002451 [Lecanora helva]
MHTTCHQGCDDPRTSAFDAREVQDMITRVAACRPMNPGRCFLGIPAEESNPGSDSRMHSSFSNGQASQPRSFERISNTSCTQSWSILDSLEDEDIPYGSEGYSSNAPAGTLALSSPIDPTHNGEVYRELCAISVPLGGFNPDSAGLRPSESNSRNSVGLASNPENVGHGLHSDLESIDLADQEQQCRAAPSYLLYNTPSYCEDLGLLRPSDSPSRELPYAAFDAVNVPKSFPASPKRQHKNRNGVMAASLSARGDSVSPGGVHVRNRHSPWKGGTSRRDNLPRINRTRKCTSSGLCDGCGNENAKLWKELPCLRIKLTEAQIHRTASLKFGRCLPKLDWCRGPNNSRLPTKSLKLYNIGLVNIHESPMSRPNITIDCQQFRPSNTDFLTKSWNSNGRKVDLLLPAYAMTTIQRNRVKEKLQGLVDSHYDKLLAELKADQSVVVRKIVIEASQWSQQCKALEGALQIAVITRLMLKSFNITNHNNSETLGLTTVNDLASPYHGRIPIPTILDAQIDTLWMEILERKRKDVLRRLNHMIFNCSRRTTWYMVFLTTLVLLLNLESVYLNQRKQIERYQTTNLIQEEMMASWKSGAENLMWHFRVGANGEVPSHMDINEVGSQAEHVDIEAQKKFHADLEQLLVSQDWVPS